MQLSYPALSSEHLQDARLYATRQDLVEALPLVKGGRIAEVGVAFGGFSKHIVECHKPAEFHAFDTFHLHLVSTIWGCQTQEVLKGMTHLDFYCAEMQATGVSCVCHVGDSAQNMATLPANHFDMIYIDAGHDYSAVKLDACLAANTVKADGILVFNDYTLYDPFAKVNYGVVQVVNEMVVFRGWKVIGFALENHMFCDIAIQRLPASH